MRSMAAVAAVATAARAMDPRVPHGERAGRVGLEYPGMQGVERRQAIPVGAERGVELLAEQARLPVVVGVPIGLEHDVLEGDQSQLAVTDRIVDDRLRPCSPRDTDGATVGA